MPGFGGTHDKAGFGEKPPNGTNGWSARGHFDRADSRGNVMIGFYVYHMDQKDEHGDAWDWDINNRGLLKPDRAIYELTLRQSGLEAERTLFIDDLRANVEGALAVGMRAIVFVDAAQVRQELTKHGVMPI